MVFDKTLNEHIKKFTGAFLPICLSIILFLGFSPCFANQWEGSLTGETPKDPVWGGCKGPGCDNPVTTPEGAQICLIGGEASGECNDLTNGSAISTSGISCVLSAIDYGDTLMPYADQIAQAAQQFGVNPLLLLAMANHDSSLGTQGAGRDNNNPGNIGCRDDGYSEAGVSAGCADFATFDTYGDGMQAMAWLLGASGGYLGGDATTLHDIVYKYAPPSENDSDGYISAVQDFMDQYCAECKI